MQITKHTPQPAPPPTYDIIDLEEWEVKALIYILSLVIPIVTSQTEGLGLQKDPTTFAVNFEGTLRKARAQ